MVNAERRHRLKPSGFFVLRTPLLPFDEFAAWGDKLDASTHAGDREALTEALRRDRRRLRERLAGHLARPEVRDALFVASPTVEALLERWQRDPESERARKTEQPLVAYFSRAAARATPFGLFAGCSTGTIAAATALQLGPREHYRRHTRLDMEYLCALGDAIQRDPTLRRELVYRPNTSLYEAGGRFHLVEASQAPGRRSYKLVAVDKTPYLEATLARAAGGATFDDLTASLIGGEITRSNAEEYVGELIESQLLVGDVEPQITGGEPVDVLARTLAARAPTAPLAARLEETTKQLPAIDADGLGTPRHRYEAVASTLAELPADVQLSRLVQVDLTKPTTKLTLGRDVVNEIINGVGILHALAPPPRHDALERFRQRFTERYETREVALVEALDDEHGIGFELLDGGSPANAQLPPTDSSQRDRLLLRKYADAMRVGAHEVTIDAGELDLEAAQARRPLPEGLEVLAALAAASSEAVAAGDFRVLIQSAAGPPGARLTARFCHADALLNEYVAGQLRAEEASRPGCIFAEIVHLPEDRVGNILSRPLLRAYEIPYLGTSASPPERQLLVADLLVSVEGERIVLRSHRLGQEVIPRMTTAHNFAFNSLSIYRFLAALQHQGVTPALLWDWGPLTNAPFLPRVVAGRAVLSRARWNLDNAEVALLAEPGSAEGFSAVQALRRARGLPRFVALADGDNELVLDLDNVLSLETLAREVKGRSQASLVELFPEPNQLVVKGPEGRFVHQLVLPLLHPVLDAGPAAPRRKRSSCTRRFAPGSEWLYVKLFSGSASTDLVLDRVAEAVEDAVTSDAADAWFFIRYGDPDWHLRLRAHGAPERLLGETLPMLHKLAQPLLDAGQVWRVQLDTYEREVERYGGDEGIRLAERLFHADSEAALALVRALGGNDSELRWRAALAGMYFLLSDFELSLEERRMIVQRACKGYADEFAVTKEFQAEMSRRYRRERPGIEALLYGDEDSWVLRPFRQRSLAVAPLAAELRLLADTGELTQPLPDVVLSFLHMHVNRLVRSAQRAHELVLYEMLSRIYSSEAARAEVALR